MKRAQALQAAHVDAQRSERVGDRRNLLGDLLTTGEAIRALAFDRTAAGDTVEHVRAVKNFFKWADRNRVPRQHRGSRVLWDPRILRDFLNREPWTKKHGRESRSQLIRSQR